jgi:hypothetical protein
MCLSLSGLVPDTSSLSRQRTCRAGRLQLSLPRTKHEPIAVVQEVRSRSDIIKDADDLSTLTPFNVRRV